MKQLGQKDCNISTDYVSHKSEAKLTTTCRSKILQSKYYTSCNHHDCIHGIDLSNIFVLRYKESIKTHVETHFVLYTILRNSIYFQNKQ